MELTRKRTGGGGSSSLKGLLATRQGTAIVALVCAAVAAAIIVVAINRYRDSVNTSNAQVSVLVANALIQKGTSGAALAASGGYTATRMIERHVTPGAISDAAVLEGKVAVSEILPGQQLTLSDFAIGTGFATQLASNERAISIPLDSSHGLTGVVQTGDRVDVYAGFNAAGAGAIGPQLRLLIPNVLVLNSSVGSGSAGGNVLLAVNDNEAAEVAYASDNGKIWLMLRPANGQNPTQTVATIQSILLGRPPIQSATGGKP